MMGPLRSIFSKSDIIYAVHQAGYAVRRNLVQCTDRKLLLVISGSIADDGHGYIT